MKKLALMLIAICLFPLEVLADSIILNCPDSVNENANFVCELSGKTTDGVYSVSAQVTLSEGLALTSFISQNNWQGDGANGNIELYTDNLQKGTFPIGSIKIKNSSKNDVKVSIDSIVFSNNLDQEITIASVSKTVKIKKDSQPSDKPTSSETPNTEKKSTEKSDNPTETDITDVSSNNLIDIEVEGYKLDFLKEETSYTLKIKNESSLNIKPILEDSDASYEIIGNSKLKNDSVIKIQVTASNNTTKTYSITIKKDDQIIENKQYTKTLIAIIVVLILINIIRIIISERKKIGGAQE